MGVKVTGYIGVFEQKLDKLIKKAKKEKSLNKDVAKRIIQEAKALREILREAYKQ